MVFESPAYFLVVDASEISRSLFARLPGAEPRPSVSLTDVVAVIHAGAGYHVVACPVGTTRRRPCTQVVTSAWLKCQLWSRAEDTSDAYMGSVLLPSMVPAPNDNLTFEHHIHILFILLGSDRSLTLTHRHIGCRFITWRNTTQHPAGGRVPVYLTALHCTALQCTAVFLVFSNEPSCQSHR